MSEKSDYILTDDGELYHYGVLGMKWGRRKNPEEPTVGQNYTVELPNASSGASGGGGGGGGVPEEDEEEEDQDFMDFIKKTDRFIETAKVWIDGKLSMKISDTLSGKTEHTSWEAAKKWVDYKHRFNDDYPKWN